MLDFNLYLITDRHASKLPLGEAVQLALKGGVRAVQLREKDLPVRELLSLAMELRKTTREFGAGLFINDRVDVAVAVDADGVHLGGQSMPPRAVRRLVGKNMLIGVSAHNLKQAQFAEQNSADFITFGPVFATPTKTQFGAPVGYEMISYVKKSISIPVFGLGGIVSAKVDKVMEAGADGIALISGILGADDIFKASEEISQMMTKWSKRGRKAL